MRVNPKTLVLLSLMAAISVGLVYLIHFPIFAPIPDLEYDPADILIVFSGLIFGPIAGLMLTAVVCFVQAMTVSAKAGIAGFIMHFIATGSMVLVASTVHIKLRKITGVAISLFLGATTMVIVMIPLNMIVTPAFYGVPLQVIKNMMIPYIIPFNVIKAFTNCTIAFFLYIAITKRAQTLLDSFKS